LSEGGWINNNEVESFPALIQAIECSERVIALVRKPAGADRREFPVSINVGFHGIDRVRADVHAVH
jgi:hypothetical protein